MSAARARSGTPIPASSDGCAAPAKRRRQAAALGRGCKASRSPGSRSTASGSSSTAGAASGSSACSSSGADGDRLPLGLCRCGACGRTSEACIWALSIQTPRADGQVTLVPHGEACHDCYLGWSKVFKTQYATWDEWVMARRSSKELASAFDKALAIFAEKVAADFPREEVTTNSSTLVQVQRHFIAVSDADLRGLLKTARVLKSQVASLRSIVMPSDADPSIAETLYLFQDPERPFRTATISTEAKLMTSAVLQPRSDSCYAGQGRFVQKAAWASSDANAAGSGAARVPTLRSYLESQGAPVPACPQVGGGLGEGAAGWLCETAGAAVSVGDGVVGEDQEDSLEYLEEPPKVIGIAASPTLALVTPTKAQKAKPAVPSFAGAASTPSSPQPGAASSPPVLPTLRRAMSSADLVDGDDRSLGDIIEGKCAVEESRLSGSQSEENEDMGDAEGCEDVLVYWRRRLPIEAMFVGESKGRSVKPLREKIARLAARKDSALDAQRLKLYLANILFAQNLRRDNLLKLPEEELRAAVTSLMQEKVAFPECVELALVEHRATSLLKRFDFATLCECCKPWSSSPATEFDPLQPVLGAVSACIAVKVAKSKSWFWQRSVCPLLLSSEDDSAARIVEISDAILKNFADEDELELDSACAIHMSECMDAATAMKCVATLAADPDSLVALSKVTARKGRTDRGLLTLVGNALMTSTRWETRAQTILKAQPVIAEFGKTVRTFEQELLSMAGVGDSKRFDRFSEMCRVMAKAQASGAGLWDDVSAALVRALKASMTATSEGLRSGQAADADLLESLQRCMQEASVAFASDADVTALRDNLGAALASQSILVKQADLDKYIVTLQLDLKAQEASTVLRDLRSKVEACMGHALPDAMNGPFGNTVENLSRAAFALQDEAPGSDILDSALDVWEVMLELQVCPKAPKPLLGIVRAHRQVLLARQKADLLPPDDFVARRPALQELAVMVHRLDDALADLPEGNDEATNLWAQVTAACDRVRTDNLEYMATFRSSDYKMRLEALETTMQTTVDLCRELHIGGRWHKDIADDWDLMSEEAEDTIAKIDTRELEKTVVALKRQLDDVDESASMLTAEAAENNPFDRARAQDLYKASKALMHEALLIHALKTDTDRERLRRSAQCHLKGLRQVLGNGGEKEWLHVTVLRRAWDCVRCK